MSLLTVSFSDQTQKGATKQVVYHNYRWAVVLIQYPASLPQGPGFPLVNGTGFQTRAGLATGLQGYGYGSGILTLPKPVPTQTRTRTRGTGMVGREQKNKNK